MSTQVNFRIKHGLNVNATEVIDPSGNIDYTRLKNLPTTFAGNADSATKLQTARTINGVAFDGTADINILADAVDNTKVAKAGDVMTGNLGLGINPTKNLHLLGGGASIDALATPAAPTVTNVGTAGTTTYNYYVIAEDRNGGKTLASAVGSTTTGNAVLDAVNYNTVSWGSVAGAVKYHVFKGGTTALLGTTTGTNFNDQGQATTAYTYVARNTTADMTIGGQSYAQQYLANGWFRNQNNQSGMVNDNNGSVWYADGNGWWNAASNADTLYPRIVLRSGHNGTVRGYLFSNADGSGLLNNAGQWAIRAYYSTGTTAGGQLYGPWQVDDFKILKHLSHPGLSHIQATQADNVWKDWGTAAYRGFKNIGGNNQGCWALGAVETEGQRLVCQIAGKYFVRLRVYTAGSVTTGRMHVTKNNGPAFACWIQNLAGEDHTNEAWAVFDMAVGDWLTYYNSSRVYMYHGWDHTCVEVYKMG